MPCFKGAVRRVSAFILIIAVLLPLTACSGVSIYTQYRELGDLELVRVVGIDAAGEDTEVTAMMSSDPEGAPDIASRTAADLPAALDQLADNPTRRQPYYSHTEHILIGEEAARRTVAPYLDYVTRSAEMRAATGLFIVRGDAGQLIKDSTDEKSDAESMLTYIATHAPDMGAGNVTSCGETAAALAGRGTALVMAVRRSETDTASAEAPARIEPAGFAVLMDGRLAGYLEPEAARGALMLMGKFRSCTAEVRDSGGSRAVLELTGARPEIEPRFDSDGELTGIKISMELKANITSLDPGCRPDDPVWRREAEHSVSESAEGWLRAAIARDRELGADCTDMESSLRRKAPVKMSRALKNTDFSERMDTINIEIECSTRLIRSYDLDMPLDVGGGQGGAESAGLDQLVPETEENGDAE